jgi:hypothetical protein
MPNRLRLIELGWRQGALLSSDMDVRLTNNAHFDIPERAILLVVSQTCDLVQGDMDREPYLEVLCLNSMEQAPGGEYAGGKNSRRIEFSFAVDGYDSQHWFALPFQRYLVDRNMLLDHEPKAFLSDDNVLAMILSWLARRYTRIAFPEVFVEQINHPKRRSSISKKFSRLNSCVMNVFIRLSPFQEIFEKEVYDIELILVMESEKFENSVIFDQCTKIKNELEYQLNQCEKIEVVDINIESTAGVTLKDLEGFKEWDYSYLSFRNHEEAEMPHNPPIPKT